MGHSCTDRVLLILKLKGDLLGTSIVYVPDTAHLFAGIGGPKDGQVETRLL